MPLAKVPVDVRPERLFPPLGRDYERAGALLSLGLEAGWRRRLIDELAPRDGELYLDLATGTGLVAREIARRARCRIVGLDLVPQMIAAASEDERIRYVIGRAERLPFPAAAFDGLVVTYLLRYVADPVATLRELARVVRPGGRIAMLEFGRPSGLAGLGWSLYTRVALPLLGSLISRDWRAVGAFLGPSVDRFHARYDVRAAWSAAGIADVRSTPLFLGSALVVRGTVP